MSKLQPLVCSFIHHSAQKAPPILKVSIFREKNRLVIKKKYAKFYRPSLRKNPQKKSQYSFHSKTLHCIWTHPPYTFNQINAMDRKWSKWLIDWFYFSISNLTLDLLFGRYLVLIIALNQIVNYNYYYCYSLRLLSNYLNLS